MKDVFAATDSPNIQKAAQKAGAKAFLTNPGLPSGTDRIFAALKQNDLLEQFDVIVNVQGDVPNISPEVVLQTANLFLKDSDASVATAVLKIEDKKKLSNPNVVKAVVSLKQKDWGRALYFTRSAAPYGEGDFFEHIGIYAYKREALKRFVSLPPSPLEQREKLEQLRALEADMKINALITTFEPISVDSGADLERARKLIF
jgi:3-deoxy-manno-octulosonate cytidylyltransferase (CMP-KDO synthetase)